MSTPNPLPPNIEGLATLLVLQDQIKGISTLKEFGYFTTNETHRLIQYNIAYLWKKSEAYTIELLDQSEVAEVDQHSPVSQWVRKAIQALLEIENVKQTQRLEFKINTLLSPELMRTWPLNIPQNAIWSPLFGGNQIITGGLIFFKEASFSDQELKMYFWLAKNYQYTWKFLTKSKLSAFVEWTKSKPRFKILAVLIILILLMPTRLSVTAPATVESQDPAPIDAPIAGTIQSFLVTPGAPVVQGQLLITLDKTDVSDALAVAEKKVKLSEAKLQSALLQGYNDPKTEEEVPILKAELAVDQSELDYTKSLLNKTEIRSPIDGVAIFDSKEDWVGQPVQAGENILTISDPKHVQLKILLPVTDLITLEQRSEGKFYIYGEVKAYPVVLTTIGYSARVMPNKVLAYEYIAKFVDPQTAPSLGTQGTVHLYGKYVPMIYFILRRPLQTLRQSFGI